jgi:hypothetical protein
MLKRSCSLALLAAVLSCSALVRAADTSVNQPIHADDDQQAASESLLMVAMDRAGIGNTIGKAGIKLGGYVEGSWTYNFARPENQTNVGRAFDFEDQDLTLNQVDLFADKEVDPSKGKFDIGGRIEWIFGADSRAMHSSGLNFYGPGDADRGGQPFPNNQFDLNQAYLTFGIPVGSGLIITAGKFVSLLGYETVNVTTNDVTKNVYSHGYLFNYGTPFSETGVMGTYNVTTNLSLTLGVARGWEQTSNDNNGAIEGFGSMTWTVNDKLKLIGTVDSGPQQNDDTSHYRTVVDVYGVYALSDSTQIVVDTNYGYGSREGNDIGFDGKRGSGDWWGAAVYLTQHLCKYSNFNARGEYFNDDDGCRGLNTSVEEITLGLAITPFPDREWLKNLVFRPELRWDHASDDIFNDRNDKNQFTAAGDLVFAF